MKKLLFLLFLITETILGQTQYYGKESYNWYFGDGAGITFSPEGNPTSINGGKIKADPVLRDIEGVASISDQNGNLLFYTDGISVWDKNHNVMPNGTGLKGDHNCTQSALIVPHPTQKHVYYLFTVGAWGTELCYSVVNMSFNQSNGDIAANQKNISLMAKSTEKITAVWHSNHKDIWVIAHDTEKKFYTWLVTSDGFGIQPTKISELNVDFNDRTGTKCYTGHPGWQYGYMKASPDGTKIVCTHYYDTEIGLFDFNNTTGEISNPVIIDKVENPYGVEFSQSGKFVYVSGPKCSGDEIKGTLYQYEISTKTIIEISTGQYFTAIQIGPNGKIYVSISNSNYLGVINNPEKSGSLCDFNSQAIDLSPNKCTSGLPNFIQSYFTINSNTKKKIDCDQEIKQHNIWCFGNYAGINFNTDPPKTFTTKMTSFEGCASISDLSGNLLFYSDGITIWRADGSVLASNLNGSDNTTQSVTIIQQPGSDHIYYLFTVAERNSIGINKGYWYYKIDLNADNQGQKGKIVESGNLYQNSSEKLAAIKHPFNDSVWVITHTNATDDYYVYMISRKGLDLTSIRSKGAFSHSGSSFWNSAGQLKVSSDGTKIGSVCWGENPRVEILGFDIETGIIDNRNPIILQGSEIFPDPTVYGLEFSPNGQILYLTDHLYLNWRNNNRLYQFDLSSGDQSKIAKTEKIIFDHGTEKISFGQLQIGPNGKIYVGLTSAQYLAYIENPEVYGSGCNYVQNGILLSSGTYCRNGLPSSIQNLCYNKQTNTQSSLVAYYPFNGNAKDETGKGNDGLVNGASLTFDRCGNPNNAYKFDGIDDFIKVANPNFKSITQGTFTAWIKYDNLNSIEYVASVCDTNTIDNYISLFRYDDIYQTPSIYQKDHGEANYMIGNTPIETGKFYHIAMTSNSQSWSIYINGKKENLWSKAGQNNGHWFANIEGIDLFVIGGIIIQKPFSPGYFAGTIDEVRIYNQALNESEIDSLYHLNNCKTINLNFINKCQNDTTSIWLSDETNVNSVTWTFGDESQQVIQKSKPFLIKHMFINPGNYLITGVVTIGNETKTIENQITILPAPVLDLGLDKYVCSGQSISIGIPRQYGFTYSWNPTTSLSCSICPNPSTSAVSNTKYTLTLTNFDGCSAKDDITVLINPKPFINLGPDKTICQGDTIDIGVQAAQGISYAWNPTNNLTCINCSYSRAFTTTSSTYTLKVTDSKSCTNNDDIYIKVNPKPALNLTDKTICYGDSTNIGITSEQGSSYFWNPSPGLNCTNCSNPIARPVETTIYSLKVTTINNCSDEDNLKLNVNPLPIINLGSDLSIITGDTIQIGVALQAGYKYIWAPAENLTCSNCSYTKIFPKTSKSYSLKVTDNKGCSSKDDIRINVKEKPVVNLGSDKSICIGDSILIGITSQPGYSYKWSPAEGLTCQDCSQIKVSPLNTTSYTLTVTNPQGVKNNGNITISVNQNPVVDLGADKSLCKGDSIQIGINNVTGFKYQWSDVKGLSCYICSMPKAFPSVSTSYKFSITDLKGCKGSGEINLRVLEVPKVELGDDKTICKGDTTEIGLSALSGQTYQWSNTGGLSCSNCSIVKAFPFETSRYKLTVKNSDGCKSSDEITVKVIDLPVFNLGKDKIICRGDSVIIGISQDTGNTYQWDTSQDLSCGNCASTMAFPYNSISYKLTVKNSNGCIGSNHIKIIVRDLPLVSLGNDMSICRGDTVVIGTGELPGNQYQWSPEEYLGCSFCTTVKFYPQNTTSYKLTVTNPFGCKNSDKILINVRDLPKFSLGDDHFIYKGDSLQIGIDQQIGYKYQWNQKIEPVNQSSSKTYVKPDNNADFFLKVTDLSGCKSIDSILVYVENIPNITLAPEIAIKQGDTINLKYPNIIGLDYSWTPSEGLSCQDCSSPKVSPDKTTTYKLNVSNTRGNIHMDSIIVKVMIPILLPSDTSICQGDSIQIGPVNPIYDSYNWYPEDYLNCTKCSNPTSKPTKTIVYHVEAIHKDGYIVSDSIKIRVIKLPELVLPEDTFVCQVKDLKLSGPAGYSYLWNDSVNNQTITITKEGKYWLKITDGQKCSNSDTILVIKLEEPKVNLGSDTAICQGSNLIVDAGEETYKYLWSTSENTHQIQIDKDGLYSVIKSNVCGTAYDSINIQLLPLPKINIGKDTTICIEDKIQLMALGSFKTITWSSGEKDSIIVVSQAADYQVKVYNGRCYNADTITIKTFDCEKKFELNNVLTPNGDNSNELFPALKESEILPMNYELSIFTRWGRLIYKTTHIKENWNGKQNENYCSPGVYYWILRYNLGKHFHKQGGFLYLFYM